MHISACIISVYSMPRPVSSDPAGICTNFSATMPAGFTSALQCREYNGETHGQILHNVVGGGGGGRVSIVQYFYICFDVYVILYSVHIMYRNMIMFAIIFV